MWTSRAGAAGRQGSALLAVLWLSAALAAIAFSLASTVRGETDRTSTAVDGLRAGYLAAGGLQRSILHVLWATVNPNLPPELRLMRPDLDIVRFPGGEVRVEIIPESARLSINTAPPEELFRLLVNLGVDGGRARQITDGIVEWRGPGQPGAVPLDQSLAGTPSFRPPHASFEETEELLLVRGMTPEIYYGTYGRPPESAEGASLVWQGGLADCVSVYGTRDRFDANTAAPALLAAAGVPPDVIQALIARRLSAPFRNDAELAQFLQGTGAAAQRLRVGGNRMFTFRATARVLLPNGQLSDLRRTVAALVSFQPVPGGGSPYQVLRWYEYAVGAAQ